MLGQRRTRFHPQEDDFFGIGLPAAKHQEPGEYGTIPAHFLEREPFSGAGTVQPSGGEGMPTVEDVKSWYDERYASYGRDAMRPFDAYPIYLSSLELGPGVRLLDMSCGSGHLLRAALDRGIRPVGIEISREAVRLAREVAPECELVIGNCEALSFADGAFDAVTCLGSLEHFADTESGLREMRRVAKDTARFCVTVPNSNFLLWKTFGFGTEQQSIIEKPLLLAEWKELLAKTGFQVISCQKERWYLKRPRVLTRGWLLRRVERFLLWLFWLLLPLSSTYQFHFVLRKA